MIPEDYYPLTNIRKSIAGSWFLVNKTESHVIPSGSPYVIRLKEVPDNGDLISAPVVSGATHGVYTESFVAPAAGYFLVRYASGEIEFNSTNASDSLNITYYAKGSAVNAEDINYLKTIIDDNYHHSCASNVTYNGNAIIPSGSYVEVVHSLGTEDILVQVQYKTAAYSWRWVDARASLAFEIYNINTLRIYNMSAEDILQANWRVFISVFNTPVLLGSSSIPILSYVNMVHSYNTQDLQFQIQTLPTSGTHQNKWIDGAGIMAVSIIDNSNLRIYNNGSNIIAAGRYRVLINLY